MESCRSKIPMHLVSLPTITLIFIFKFITKRVIRQVLAFFFFNFSILSRASNRSNFFFFSFESFLTMSRDLIRDRRIWIESQCSWKSVGCCERSSSTLVVVVGVLWIDGDGMGRIQKNKQTIDRLGAGQLKKRVKRMWACPHVCGGLWNIDVWLSSPQRLYY